MNHLARILTPLDDQDPKGRLDIAVFRIVERLAEPRWPAEWAVLRLLVAECCRRALEEVRLVQ